MFSILMICSSCSVLMIFQFFKADDDTLPGNHLLPNLRELLEVFQLYFVRELEETQQCHKSNTS